VFGLSEGGKPRAQKSRGVVLLRNARRSSWLAGWTQPTPPPPATGRVLELRAGVARDGAPAKTRNRP
jgi:hypothetical protein